MGKGLSEKIKEKIANELAVFTADTFVLYVKTLHFHWNMEGPQFFMYHKLLEAQYLNLGEAADALAERIRQLGQPAPGTMKEFLELTTLEEGESRLSQNEMIQVLIEDHETLEEDCAALIALVDENEDPGSSDLLAERIRFHAKEAWLLRSHLI